MKNFFVLLSFLLFSALGNFLTAQSPIGIWKTVDKKTKKVESLVEIYEEDGVLRGKILKIIEGDENSKCEKCEGDKKNKPMLGLEIIWGLKPYKDYWSYGSILDPRSGKVYNSEIRLESEDVLKLRGYIGAPMFGRTETWERLK